MMETLTSEMDTTETAEIAEIAEGEQSELAAAERTETGKHPNPGDHLCLLTAKTPKVCCPTCVYSQPEHPKLGVCVRLLTPRAPTFTGDAATSARPVRDSALSASASASASASTARRVRDSAVSMDGGRGVHSSTCQLNLSRFLSFTPPSDKEYPTKRSYVKPKSGRV